jgi:hypothetical protein
MHRGALACRVVHYAQVPLVEHKSKSTWRAKIAGLRAAAAEAGRPELLLANNEYGLGKPAALTGFTRFGKGMVAAEFALEMFVGGYDMAAFWDNGDGGKAASKGPSDQMLMDSSAAFRMNPMHLGMQLLARATSNATHNASFHAVEVGGGEKRVHGFAAAGGGGRALLLYLINKLEATESGAAAGQAVRVTLPAAFGAAAAPSVDGVAVASWAATATSMVDTADHWGELDSSAAVTCTGNACDVVLPPVSLTLVTLQRRNK